ncbi:acyltransferase [Altererythrobacter luteolus]|uniref:Acyltransferase n=1 Tax=Pontixanthobacter luteolus TaxID=295089 RepID=A0A6I4V0U2_9SPHN|nr:acyltransferase [Pontixanthobacter luteolus]
MARHLTLAQYVRRRNGVPLGHKRSLQNMLGRSLGASSLAGFWRHWNPIWSYGLGRYILSPLQRVAPQWLALVVTFAVSGVLHDLVMMAIRKEIVLLFTPWFSIQGIAVVISSHFGWSFDTWPWPARAAMNLAYIIAGLALAFAARLNLGF